jgi:predicted RNA methylase
MPDAKIRKLKERLLLEDVLFAKLHRVNVADSLLKKDLAGTSEFANQHATWYHACSLRTLREIFREIRCTNVRFDNFIDLGSGEGKACFYASIKLEVQNVMGIEFSKKLFDASQSNLSKFSQKNISFFHGDASEYEIPEGNNIVFLYNPFDAALLEKFLARNVDHFRNNSKSLVAYANDCHRHSLIKSGFEAIYRNQITKNSIYVFSMPRTFAYE